MKHLKLLTFILCFIIGLSNVNALTDLNAIIDDVAPDYKISLNSIRPHDSNDLDFYTNLIFMEKSASYEGNIQISLGNCDNTFTTCTLSVVEYGENDQPIGTESHNVTVTWKNTNSDIKTIVDSHISTLTAIQGKNEWDFNNQYYFDITDMNLINYYVTANTNEVDDKIINKTISYSEDIRNMFKGINLTYAIDFRAGSGYVPFDNHAFGALLFKYNNVVYGFDDAVGIRFKEIIYVPSDTELTDTALITAANKRIKNYLPDSNINITAGFALNTFEDCWGESYDFSTIVDLTKTSSKSYNINFGDFSVPFLIVADSTKMKNPEFITKDIGTNIKVTSQSSSIPLDSIIDVNRLDENSDEYKKLLKIIEAEKMESYDISLFSNVKNENITKLDDGSFEVRIPISEKFKGKDLFVYYVDNTGKKVEYKVTVDGDYAVFNTNHFSIYTLADTSKTLISEENPQTFDGIMNSILLGSISMIGIVGCGLFLNKRKRIN